MVVTPSRSWIARYAVPSESRVTGIERAERLVHQHHVGPCGDGAGDAGALALAARQRMGQAGGVALRQLDEIEQFGDAGIDLGARPSEELRRDADVLADRHVRKQADALEHIADASAQQRSVEGLYRDAVDANLAPVRLDQPVDELHRRGLAGAGGADQGDEALRLDRERDVAQREVLPAVEGLGHAVQFDEGLGHHAGSRPIFLAIGTTASELRNLANAAAASFSFALVEAALV